MDNAFKPMDLNFETVKQIFSECMPVEGKTQCVYAVRLQQVADGFPKNSDPILFDEDRINANVRNVRYLLGQLYILHKGEFYLNMSDVLKKYNGYLWSKEKVAPILFLHLGIGTGNITAPNAENMRSIINGNVEPTLSPKDPAFPKWWEQNKGKWE